MVTKAEEVTRLRREQQAMLASLDEVERDYQNRPEGVEADPELERMLMDSRRALADQQVWLLEFERLQAERQVTLRKTRWGIVIMILVLVGIVLFSRT